MGVLQCYVCHFDAWSRFSHMLAPHLHPAGDPDRDPAWLTCAAGALTVPVFDFLFVAPTKAVIDSRVMIDQPVAERESWLRSWGRKQIVDVALKVATFGALLLVLGAKGEDGALARLTRPR